MVKSYPPGDRDKLCEQLTYDMVVLEEQVMDLFRQHDHEAKVNQNRYRWRQIWFLVLAAVATIVGGLQAISLHEHPDHVPIHAFIETLIALFATFIITVGGRRSAFDLWLTNRRKAEQLRREYFRYLLRLPPYDKAAGVHNEMTLGTRAWEISAGNSPDEPKELPALAPKPA